MEPILRVTDLSKSFSRAGKNEFFAVDHVSFDVMPGEILGIVMVRISPDSSGVI